MHGNRYSYKNYFYAFDYFFPAFSVMGPDYSDLISANPYPTFDPSRTSYGLQTSNVHFKLLFKAFLF